MSVRKDRLQPGEEHILSTAVLSGVLFEDVERQVPRTIGVTRSYRLAYDGYTRNMLASGEPEQVCAEYRAYVDGIPARIEAAETAQQGAILEVAHAEFERDRYRQSINPLNYHGAIGAYEAAHGGKCPAALYRRWAHEGVTEAEYRSDWYQAGLARAVEAGTVRCG